MNVHTKNSAAYLQEWHIWKTATFYFTFSAMPTSNFVNVLKFIPSVGGYDPTTSN